MSTNPLQVRIFNAFKPMITNLIMICKCGGRLKKIGEIGNTRKYVCAECYEENIKYIEIDECEHGYNSKHICIHCGKLDNA